MKNSEAYVEYIKDGYPGFVLIARGIVHILIVLERIEELLERK